MCGPPLFVRSGLEYRPERTLYRGSSVRLVVGCDTVSRS